MSVIRISFTKKRRALSQPRNKASHYQVTEVFINHVSECWNSAQTQLIKENYYTFSVKLKELPKTAVPQVSTGGWLLNCLTAEINNIAYSFQSNPTAEN